MATTTETWATPELVILNDLQSALFKPYSINETGTSGPSGGG